MTVRMDGDKEKTVTFDPKDIRHFDHGYAVTSHSSRGLTAERVIVKMDTDVHPELMKTIAAGAIRRHRNDRSRYQC
jgi:ATP-dependent exoDNAse (exonuclease V) alpha subunit